ncbi:hypothetical protein [Humisphaera borealis]|uniref:Tetratricopeptide repeat protein n=1 Tax=Humisphaera borealis TaxID=2807512 RepID=A0A7M2WT49_9BACT|nr:hypothetical protein [Humisphaera borealis]QOV87780.1 hypothetical protein IPV69_15980 [Humisphaera borealis]
MMTLKRILAFLLTSLPCACGMEFSAAGADGAPAVAGPQSREHTERLVKVVERSTAALARDAKDVDALQARGEANFRLGRIADSVRDFDKVVELAPDSLPYNWQRGLALYYAGRLEDGVKQFERHRTVNPEDVENATWHYLCLAKSLGKEKGPAEARNQFIPISADTRVPLMKVHALYAGKATVQEVIDAAKAGDPPPGALKTQLFYAHLYIALYYEAQADDAKAKEHMTLAATTYGVDGYMGDVARVHAWWLAQKSVPATAPAKP